jgi:hypothetical protein
MNNHPYENINLSQYSHISTDQLVDECLRELGLSQEDPSPGAPPPLTDLQPPSLDVNSTTTCFYSCIDQSIITLSAPLSLIIYADSALMHDQQPPIQQDPITPIIHNQEPLLDDFTSDGIHVPSLSAGFPSQEDPIISTPQFQVPPPLVPSIESDTDFPSIAIKSVRAYNRPRTSKNNAWSQENIPHNVSTSDSCDYMNPEFIRLKAFAEKFRKKRIMFGYTCKDVARQISLRFQQSISDDKVAQFEDRQMDYPGMIGINKYLEQWIMHTGRTRGLSDKEVKELSSGYQPIIKKHKAKHRRTSITESQRLTLKNEFMQENKPNRSQLLSISEKVELDIGVVRIWFKNTRRQRKLAGKDDTSSELSNSQGSTCDTK